MKKKLYGLLKSRLFDDAFMLLLALASPFILFCWIFARTVEQMNPIFSLALWILCLFAIIRGGISFAGSFKDYLVYMRNNSAEEVTGKVVSFHLERTGKQSHKYPVVRDDVTGAELIMKIKNANEAVKGRRYKFLYLENTKLAVIAETIWDDPSDEEYGN